MSISTKPFLHRKFVLPNQNPSEVSNRRVFWAESGDGRRSIFCHCHHSVLGPNFRGKGCMGWSALPLSPLGFSVVIFWEIKNYLTQKNLRRININFGKPFCSIESFASWTLIFDWNLESSCYSSVEKTQLRWFRHVLKVDINWMTRRNWSAVSNIKFWTPVAATATAYSLFIEMTDNTIAQKCFWGYVIHNMYRVFDFHKISK